MQTPASQMPPKMVPAEPAAWADWGILALRQGSFDVAEQRLNRARDLAPSNDRIFYLLGILESSRGNTAASISDLRQAVKLNPASARANYQLALEIERQGGNNSEAEFQQIIQKILGDHPDNLAALLELSRIAAKRGDSATLQPTVARIVAQSAAWPAAAKQQLDALKSAAASTPPTAAAVRSVFLRNVLMQAPEFRQSLAVLKAPPGEEAEPFQHFLRLPSPDFLPAPPDLAMHFDLQPIADSTGEKWDYIGAVSLSGVGTPSVVTANSNKVHLSTGASVSLPRRSNPCAAFPRSQFCPSTLTTTFAPISCSQAQAACVSFARMTPASSPMLLSKLSSQKTVANANYTGAWAVDIEADGDLDMRLGISKRPASHVAPQ